MATIRPATDQDAAAIAALLGELGYPTSAASVPERLERLRESGAPTLVAEANGSVVGMVTMHLMSVIIDTEPIVQLTSLAVLEAARGSGVGRELVSAVEEWARARGCSRIIVNTALHRAGAHEFYKRIGYEHTGHRYVKQLR